MADDGGEEFPALWARIRRALAPGGVVAGQLFGTRDTWADDPGMTFHTRHQAETLLDDQPAPAGTSVPLAGPRRGGSTSGRGCGWLPVRTSAFLGAVR